jgi:hypothetical protein
MRSGLAQGRPDDNAFVKDIWGAANVDDAGWTMTVAARRLREAGAVAVLPPKVLTKPGCIELMSP